MDLWKGDAKRGPFADMCAIYHASVGMAHALRLLAGNSGLNKKRNVKTHCAIPEFVVVVGIYPAKTP